VQAVSQALETGCVALPVRHLPCESRKKEVHLLQPFTVMGACYAAPIACISIVLEKVASTLELPGRNSSIVC